MAVAPSTGPNSEQSDIGLGRTLDICRRGSDVKTAFAVLGVQRTPVRAIETVSWGNHRPMCSYFR